MDTSNYCVFRVAEGPPSATLHFSASSGDATASYVLTMPQSALATAGTGADADAAEAFYLGVVDCALGAWKPVLAMLNAEEAGYMRCVYDLYSPGKENFPPDVALDALVVALRYRDSGTTESFKTWHSKLLQASGWAPDGPRSANPISAPPGAEPAAARRPSGETSAPPPGPPCSDQAPAAGSQKEAAAVYQRVRGAMQTGQPHPNFGSTSPRDVAKQNNFIASVNGYMRPLPPGVLAEVRRWLQRDAAHEAAADRL